MLVSGIDDLFIDIACWVRRFKRYVVYYRRNGYMDYKQLFTATKQHLDEIS